MSEQEHNSSCSVLDREDVLVYKSPEGSMPPKETVRLAAIGDLHCTKSSAGAFQALFAKVTEQADVLALCGDLTDYGTAEEAQILARELLSVKVPIVGVLGNHDYESNQADDIKRILRDAGVIILDGEACEVHGIGFAGVKGFCGGFGRCTLGAWGESAVKAFVQEAVAESLKLEAALARLRTDQRVALLHYSPIAATVVGEPVDIYPFLGTGRLEEPLSRYPVTAVFHGHAHSGSPEGTTHGGIPVYNVAMPLLRKTFPEQPAFKLVEIPVAQVVPHNENPVNPNVLNLTQNTIQRLGA